MMAGTGLFGQRQLKHGVDWEKTNTLRVTSAPAGAHLTYYGGKIVAHPVYVNVLWSTSSVDTFGTDIQTYLTDLGTMIPQMLGEYNTSSQTMGQGTFGGTYTLVPASLSTTVADSTIQTQLVNWIKAGSLVAPAKDGSGNPVTVYNVMFPLGTTITQGGTNSCQAGGFCAYHGTVAASTSVGEFYYVVMPSLAPGSGCATGCGSAATTEQNFTSVLSHEIYETITDAEVGLAVNLGPPLAWYDNTNGEIGDICNAQQGTLPGPSGKTWTMQFFFSNSANNCILRLVGSTQTITFNQPANQLLSTGSVTLTATASSGLPVSFTGGTASVCSVASNGKVTFLGPGNCSVTATQPGGTNNGVTWAAAPPVTRTFSITGGTKAQTITFPAIPDQTLGAAPVTLQATASSGLAVTYTSTTSTVCTVSGNQATLVAIGSCSIRADQAGNGVYAPAPSVTNTFKINPGGLTNGGFETGNLSGWTATGTATVVAHGHTGTYAAQVGGTSPTNGDSTIRQTFAVPTGKTQLSLWYRVTCPDTLTYDWALVTLKDNTTNATTTVVPRTCTNNGTWVNAVVNVIAGRNYTLTLLSHDDNYPGDATYTWYDDVVLK